MKRFFRAVSAILFVAALGLSGACGGESVESLGDEACKCKTKECFDEVGEKFEKLAKKHLDKNEFDKLKDMDAVEEKVEKCMAENLK